jgi:hypothetical protein
MGDHPYLRGESVQICRTARVSDFGQEPRPAARPGHAPPGSTPPMARDRRQVTKRGRLLGAAALSVVSHLLILLALLSARTSSLKAFHPEPVTVELVDTQRLAPEVTALASTRTSPAKPLPPRTIVRPAPAPPDIDPLPAEEAPTAESGTELSDAQLAGAATADSGSTGRTCDMARRVQGALRKDPLVRAAVAGSGGKATMVWNGDWVRSQGEDGKGLAAVREAIMWEVAFAPEACRVQPMRGLVLISLDEAAGSARLAVGADEWRWSDLLTPRSAVSGDASSRR